MTFLSQFLKKSTDTRLSRKRERQKQARWKISLFLNSLLSQEREEARKVRRAREVREVRRAKEAREEELKRRRSSYLPHVRKVFSTEQRQKSLNNQYTSYMRR